ncbi:MAG: ATP-binding protein [Firmicutes bacterium]|nr:ATP-binding protein [Bacillota bacterium]
MYLARAQARAMAEAMGFDRYAVTEMETAVSELVQNVLRYGVSGEAWLRRSGGVFEIICGDRGPGFRGTAGTPPKGLGIGLTGVRRLMDTVALFDMDGGGARVTARRRLPGAGPEQEPAGRRTTVAVALRLAEGEAVSGDGYLVVQSAAGLLIAVIDGLGHGEGAARAADTVRSYLTGHAADPLSDLLQGAHEAARPTRGAVVGLVRLSGEVASCAGIGNIRTVDLTSGREIPSLPGCLGVHWPGAREERLPFSAGSRLLLTTDGVPPDGVPQRADGPLGNLVEGLVAQADGRDDALALAFEHPPE